MNKLEIPCKILDKRTKDGWFGRKYYVTFKLLSHAECKSSPVGEISDTVQEIQIDDDGFYAVDTGKVYTISFVQNQSGLWNVYRPH